ncbi:MAG: hypothetical protein M1828_004443 [Chrysothrix sp. TS-e1954]|nr:MAG: hypothetical protein M1828_004443 [Chrysothrix sp. TS-e1954]
MQARVAPLLWINGFPGSGKLTIAKALTALLNEQDSILIDNHQLIDPVEKLLSRADPGYQAARRHARSNAFETFVRSPAMASKLVVFTDFQSNNDLGRGVAAEYEQAAQKSGRTFMPVNIECSVKVNLQRVQTLGRKDSATGKMIDAELLREMRSKSKLFTFDDCEVLELDVTHLTAAEAARKLLEHIKNVYIV